MRRASERGAIIGDNIVSRSVRRETCEIEMAWRGRGGRWEGSRESEAKGTQTCKGYQQSACWELYLGTSIKTISIIFSTRLKLSWVRRNWNLHDKLIALRDAPTKKMGWLLALLRYKKSMLLPPGFGPISLILIHLH